MKTIPYGDFIRSRVRVSVNPMTRWYLVALVEKSCQRCTRVTVRYGKPHSSLSDLSSKANAHAVVQEVDVNFLSHH